MLNPVAELSAVAEASDPCVASVIVNFFLILIAEAIEGIIAVTTTI
jgi:hypothetical protein